MQELVFSSYKWIMENGTFIVCFVEESWLALFAWLRKFHSGGETTNHSDDRLSEYGGLGRVTLYYNGVSFLLLRL